MTTKSSNPNFHEDEINITEVLMVLWSAKFKILFFVFFAGIVSFFYAISLPNQYKATVVLAPSQSDGGGLSGTLDQLGGLASLAGVNIGSRDTRESQVAQEIMKSWSFIDKFINDNDLDVEVFAAEDWDKEYDKLKINSKNFNVERNEWLLKDISTGQRRPPSSWELFQKFSGMLSVSEDKKSGLVSVSLDYFSPTIAKQWLDMYVDAINKHMQARQVIKVANNIEYLEAQINKTSIAEMREVFYTIIEEQIKNKMVAEASPDYAFVTVSPSMVPERKSQPKRSLILVFGVIIGFLLAIFFVLFFNYARALKTNSKS